MRQEAKAATLKRLGRIEGQVRGLARMVEGDRYCIDIVTQISAVRAALRRAEEEILRDHVGHCVEGAIASLQLAPPEVPSRDVLHGWGLAIIGMFTLGFGWAAVESGLYYGAARKRLRLGLSEPAVTNRSVSTSKRSRSRCCAPAARIVASAPSRVCVCVLYASAVSCRGAALVTGDLPTSSGRGRGANSTGLSSTQDVIHAVDDGGVTTAPVAQSAEAADSKSVQCAFESHRGHPL